MMLDFRERLIEEADEAFSHICMHENYEEGLGVTADILEEFFAQELAQIIEPLLLSLSDDLAKVSRQMLIEVEDFRERRKQRERIDKIQENQIDKVVEKAQELAKKK